MDKYYDTVEARRLVKVATLAVGFLALFLLAQFLVALKTWQTPNVAASTIVVNGQGDAFATADVATFTFSVSADAKMVSDAQSSVTKKIDAITGELKNLGIADKDIRTTDYNVYPKYSYVSQVCPANGYCQGGRQVADGYTVTHSITVKVRKTDDAGKALAAVGDNGGTNVSGLSFTIDDPNAIEAEARDNAVQDARAKAEVLAKSLGVSLGRVVGFDEGGSNIPYPIYAMADMAGGSATKSAPSLPVGQNKVTSNVSITYEIK